MNTIIGCDAHKHFSLFAILDALGELIQQVRVGHAPGEIRAFLSQFPEGTPVALETVGNWYCLHCAAGTRGSSTRSNEPAVFRFWLMLPRPELWWATSTPVPGTFGKTDKLDATGLATLVHLGSLSTVWLPPGEIRDEPELHRTRMAFTKSRTALKNRIHATLAKYALNNGEHSDIVVGQGRTWLETILEELPPETGRCLHQQLQALDEIQGQIAALESHLLVRIQLTPNMRRLKTIPGVGHPCHCHRTRDRHRRSIPLFRPSRGLCWSGSQSPLERR